MAEDAGMNLFRNIFLGIGAWMTSERIISHNTLKFTCWQIQARSIVLIVLETEAIIRWQLLAMITIAFT